MPNPRRRGDSDDEGAAPPINHRYSSFVPGSMSASSSSQHSGLAGFSDPNRSAPFARSLTGPSPRQQSAAGRAARVGTVGDDLMIDPSRYSNAKLTELPSRWILDAQDRAMMSVTALDRTSLNLSHSPNGYPTCVTALPKTTNGRDSDGARNHCLVVTDHSIPVEYLKEIALKNGDQQNGNFLDDPMSKTSATIDQILSNLRSKPFGGSVTAKRATSASLYPSLHGERNNTRDKSGGNSHGRSTSPVPTTRKTTSSPVYYFEITIETLPENAIVSVGMVVCDAPDPKSSGTITNNPAIPGETKNSIGLMSTGELKVSGRAIEDKKFSLEDFQAGDVIGCALELVGTRRLLFTKNGKTIIPPTRFQDVEPRHNAYSPSLGIIIPPPNSKSVSKTSSIGVTALANFGAKSGAAFRWEESELLHIVNSSVSQMDQKKPPPSAASMKPASINGPSSLFQSENDFKEHRPAPPQQLYRFGKPSATAEGLMESHEAMPAFISKEAGEDDSDDAHNDISSNHRSGKSSEFQVSQQTQRVAGLARRSQLSLDVPESPSKLSPKSSPSQRKKSSNSQSSKVPASPSGKVPGRSKSPRILFNFGRSSKKNSQETSAAPRSSPETNNEATSFAEKASSRSNSPVFFGSRRRKKKISELLDDDEDENDLDQQQSEALKKVAATVQETPPANRQTPSNSKNTHPGSNPPVSGVAEGQAIASAPNLTTQASGNLVSPGATPMIFGKKSKKSSLDDDNPTDVQLQTAISNSFPTGISQPHASANGTSDVSAMAAATGLAQTNHISLDTGTPTMFGKKSKKSSLDDDSLEENHLQETFGNPTAPQGWSAVANAQQPSATALSPVYFGKKSKKSNLEDDSPEDNQLQESFQSANQGSVGGMAGLPNVGDDPNSLARAALVFGSKSKTSSLEDDDTGDFRYQSHTSMTFGSKSKKGSLEDDDPDDDRYQNHSMLPSSLGMKNSSGDNGSSHERFPIQASVGDGPPVKKSIVDGDDPVDLCSQAALPAAALNGNTATRISSSTNQSQGRPGNMFFNSKNTKGNLEDDNRDGRASDGNMFDSRNNQNLSEGDRNNVRRHSTEPGHNAEFHTTQRQQQNMSMPAGAGSDNTSSPRKTSGNGAQDAPRNSAGAIGSQDQLTLNGTRPTMPFSSHVTATATTHKPAASATAATSAASRAEGATEDDMLNAAIEESKRDQKKYELKGEATNSSQLKDPDEIETIRENTRTLRSLCSDESVDASVLEGLLDYCRKDRAKVQACLESDDHVDLMEMLALNDLVLEAINLGEKVVEGSKKRASTSPNSSKTNLFLDIPALVEKKDIFSLICILRAQSDQRLDAALALMNFAREADGLAEAGTRSLRDEIRSAGGMHSLITVFRSKGASYELRVVSALAVAYVLPSFVESSSVHPSVGLKIMECLRFLSTSRSVSPSGKRISREEMYKAAAMGVTTFWINELTPMLNSGMPKTDSTAERSDLFSRTSKKGKRRGRTGGQRHQTLELQELLEMTVSLIVQIERLGESEAVRNHQSTQADSLFLWRYTNVEQVCAVDVARPIAVREGLLPILVGWIRSKDREKVRPAVSALRYLTSIKDKYMAGWIHSQMVNEGALAEVVKLADDYYVGQDVRLAVAQILASLCVAPHTRAAVVEAKCINYLIGFLYDHSDNASQDVALFAGSAILQLAEGAITRASVLGGGDTELHDGASPDKSDTLVDDIVNSGAIGSFIAIAINHEGKLRSMSIEAIRVLSEDTSPNRRTRSQLCEEGAAMALGRALKDDVSALHTSITADTDRIGAMDLSLDELHDALCALANILEPIQPGNVPTTKLRFVPSNSDPTQNLIQGCIETAESGGLDSLLWISSLPLNGTTISDSTEFTVQRIDLLEEACRSLASLSPLLLSKEPAAQGYARCADRIFEAFDRILMQESVDAYCDGSDERNYEEEAMLELSISALRGLGALATAEPLKIKIVDKTLPCLLQMRNSQGNGSDVSNFVGQVFLSLGFEEDEIAVQVAGSNPNLLADWFCLQRSLIIQAMARSEIRSMLLHIWKTPFSETKKDGVTRLIRESSVRRTGEDKVSHDSFAESFAEIDLFESFADDDYSEHLRNSMTRQYHEFYNMGTSSLSAFDCDRIENKRDEVSLLARHMYPLNDTQTEIDWMLSHDESIYSKNRGDPSLCTQVSAPAHVDALLDCCFPSRLLRNHVVPIFNLRPEATFNFRALTMPQRRYFSFRREGQLISRLCDKQAESLDFDDVHWTLGFMNSTFAGEFSETFVQALYLCPTIRGLSFGKTKDCSRLHALDGDDEASDDGRALLANLVGSLPPWIQSLTFSNIFTDREVKTLVGIIETMGKLSSEQAAKAMGGFSARGRDTSSTAQTQGKFWSFAISSSPRISQGVWYSFFSLLGRVYSIPTKVASSPLSSLKVLDSSFNNLGDETCSSLVELVHNPQSGCTLEQLDLSGNGIRKGTGVLNVLRCYVEHHRFNAAAGVNSDRSSWQASLHTLNLSANSLGVGKAAIEIVALLEHNALSLKVLDLSSNGFDPTNVEYELCQVLVNSLEHNCTLCHLNLSNNSFSSKVLDDLLGRLSECDSDCGLAFLGLDNNKPALTMKQEDCLESFLHKARRTVLQRCLNERGAAMNGELLEAENMTDANSENMGYMKSDLSIIGESTVLKDQESDFTKSVVDELEGQPGDNMITVLFSAPLVFTNERRQLKPFAKLDFDMERELMWQCMKEASRDIELFFDNATHDRLLAAITKRCSCLHYSGHGHPSYLPFEDGGGGPNWFKVEDIQRLIAREGAAPFKFVFVSACHSGLAGETFASAGVPHVVCCQQEFELKDTAALAFTRQFYLSLVIGHTVRESFEQGCKAVRATPNLRNSEKEMKKFLLLPKDGNHDVPIFNAKAVLEWPKVTRQQLHSRPSRRPMSITRIRNLHAGGARSSELGVRNMMQEDPSPTPPQFFLGREVEMYYVLKAILCKRLVSVVAEPGLGRSSLVCALCHYINERASTIIAIERIYFVKAKRSRRVDGCRALMEQLLRKLVEAGKEHPPDPGVDMEDLFDFICKALKNEKALVVFDRMEYLENSDDAEEFPMLLSTLFRGTKNVKILVTGRRPIGIPSLGGQVEYPFPLGPLTFENTLRLFANLCPHLHTAGERHKLFERLSTDGEQSELRPSDSGISERTKAIFKAIGDGIPNRIELAAYDISSESLRQLLDEYG